MNFTKLLSKYGIESLVILLLLAYVVNLLMKYLNGKGKSGFEFMTTVDEPTKEAQIDPNTLPLDPAADWAKSNTISNMEMPEIQPLSEQIGYITQSRNSKIPNLQLRKSPKVPENYDQETFNCPTAKSDKYDRIE